MVGLLLCMQPRLAVDGQDAVMLPTVIILALFNGCPERIFMYDMIVEFSTIDNGVVSLACGVKIPGSVCSSVMFKFGHIVQNNKTCNPAIPLFSLSIFENGKEYKVHVFYKRECRQMQY